jgi:dienelactone hydrolase
MRRFISIVFLTLASFALHAAVVTEEIKYEVGGKEFTGFLAYDKSVKGKRPGVMVMHEWWGHDDYSRKRAKMLAKLGYTAFALDMYGTGVHAKHPDDAKKFMNAIFSDMGNTKARFRAAHDILKKHETVDASKTASLGYCMGGGLGLALARGGEELDGVIVVHGSLGTKTPAKPGDIKAKILVLNGAADPFVPAEQVAAFEKEMKAAKVDYKLFNYEGAKHSFSVKGADKKGKKFNLPLEYNKKADQDSWKQIQIFLKEIF